MRMVDEVGVEPTLFLMSRIYSPLPSPTGHTHPYNLLVPLTGLEPVRVLPRGILISMVRPKRVELLRHKDIGA